MARLFTFPLIRVAFVFLLGFGIWTAAIYVTHSSRSSLNYLYSPAAAVFYFTGAALAITGVRKVTLQSTAGKMLGSLAAAITLYGLADFLWGYYTIVLKIPIPYPSLSDALYMLYYPFMAAAFFYLYSLFGSVLTRRKILESLGVFIVSFILIFFVIIRPELPQNGHLTSANIFDIAYPFFDVVLVTLVFLGIRISSGKIKTVLPYFLFGLGLEVASDLWFSRATEAGYYVNGGIIDWGYLLASMSVFLGIAAVIRSFEPTLKPTPGRNAQAGIPQ